MTQISERLVGRYQHLFEKRAYVWWYVSEGMEEGGNKSNTFRDEIISFRNLDAKISSNNLSNIVFRNSSKKGWVEDSLLGNIVIITMSIPRFLI